MNDNDELLELFDLNGDEPIRLRNPSPAYLNKDFNLEQPSVNFGIKSTQWSSSDGEIFLPTSNTTPTLIPGYYEIDTAQDIGLYFRKLKIKLDGIIRFPDAVTDRVLKEVETFWAREAIYQEYDLTFKRGLLLYSKPGTGKSSTLQLISKDVIDKGGIVIKFTNPYVFQLGIKKLRDIQPDTPVVVLMEDIDSTLEQHSETEVINILDGVIKLDKIVFVATTNYPERLGPRIISRPSRFDKRFKVGALSDESRRIYFNFLFKGNKHEHNLDQWVADTKDMSIAHLKELFTAVVIIGDEYEEAIETLKTMHTQASTESEGGMGFRKY